MTNDMRGGEWQSTDAIDATAAGAYGDTGISASAVDPADSESAEVEEIVVEIDETRADLTETVEAIGQKLAPENIARDARQAVRDATIGRVEDMTNTATAAVSDAGETIQEAGSGIAATIRQNPIPAAMAAIGIGWLAMNRQSSQPSYRRASWSSMPNDTGSSRFDRVQGRMTDGLSDAGGSVGDAVASAQQSVGKGIESAQQTAGQLPRQLGGTAQTATSQAQQLWRQNPLGVAVLGLAAGMAAGMLLPSTTAEKQTMGPARDRLIDKAETTLDQTMDRVDEQVSKQQQGS
jgi:uncharacterized protein DUF3618